MIPTFSCPSSARRWMALSHSRMTVPPCAQTPPCAGPRQEQAYRRAAAETESQQFIDGLSLGAVEIVESEQELLFASPGVQIRQMKKLRRGHIPWAGRAGPARLPSGGRPRRAVRFYSRLHHPRPALCAGGARQGQQQRCRHAPPDQIPCQRLAAPAAAGGRLLFQRPSGWRHRGPLCTFATKNRWHPRIAFT